MRTLHASQQLVDDGLILMLTMLRLKGKDGEAQWVQRARQYQNPPHEPHLPIVLKRPVGWMARAPMRQQAAAWTWQMPKVQ